ncbi:MAG TPA: hypothetical protein EYG57_18580 [Planctomycetes bacterium]|nr:hypothetical protein [Planctomycetota bacterium]
MKIRNKQTLPGRVIRGCMVIGCLFMMTCSAVGWEETAPFELKVVQVTSGEKHHFFAYIGHCQTIPWNASGRYILGMEIGVIDRMPKPDEAATIIPCGQKSQPTRKLRLQADLETRFGPLSGRRLRSSIPVRPAQPVPFGPSSGRSLGHSHSPRLSLAPS